MGRSPQTLPADDSHSRHLQPFVGRVVAPVLAAAVLTPVAVFLHSYKFVNDDQILYIPILMRRLNPALYPGDYFFNQPQASVSLFEDVLIWPIRWFGLEWTLFVAYVIVQWAILLCLFLLARQLTAGSREDHHFGGDLPAYLAMVLFLLPISVGGTFVRTFDNYFNPRTMTLPLALLALLFLARRRPWPVAVLVSVHLLLHPLSGLHTWCLASLMMFWWLGRRALPRRAVVLPLVVMGVVMAGLYLGSGGSGSDLFLDAAWRDVLWRRTPYVFLSSWTFDNWLSLALYLVAGLLGWAAIRRLAPTDELGVAVLVSVGLCTIGVALGVDTLGLAPLVQLQLARSWWMVVVLSLIFGAALCYRLCLKGGWGSTLLACVLAATLAAERGREEWQPVLGLLLAAAAVSVITGGSGKRAALLVAEWLAAAAALSLLGPPILGCIGIDFRWPADLFGVEWELPRDSLSPALLAVAVMAATRFRRDSRTASRLAIGLRSVVVLLALAAGLTALDLRHAPSNLQELASERWQVPWTAGWMSVQFRDWRDVQVWAEASTPQEALFATDPDDKGFRVFSLRSPLVEEKDGAPAMFGRAYALEWDRRMKAMAAAGVVDTDDVKLTLFDVFGLEKLHSLVGFDFVVARRPQNLPWPVVFENETYAVYSFAGK